MKSIHVLAGFLTLTLFACGGRKDNQVTTDLIPTAKQPMARYQEK